MMHDNGIEKGKTPIDRTAEDHNINKKGQDNVFEQYRVFFNKPARPERIQKTTGEIAQGIFFKVYCHFCLRSIC
jgi:hypothetical protein